MQPIEVKICELSDAKNELTKIQVHPTGVEIMALKAVFRVVKFLDVNPQTANIVKQEMLARGGDVAVAGTVGKFEDKKTDIIIMGTLAQYIRLIKKLEKQPYGDCSKIGLALEEFLFKNFSLEKAAVW